MQHPPRPSTHHVPTCSLLLLAPCSPLPAPCFSLPLLLPVPCLPLPAFRSLLSTPRTLLPAPCFSLPAYCSLLPDFRCLPPAPCSSFPAGCFMLPTCKLFLMLNLSASSIFLSTLLVYLTHSRCTSSLSDRKISYTDASTLLISSTACTSLSRICRGGESMQKIGCSADKVART